MISGEVFLPSINKYKEGDFKQEMQLKEIEKLLIKLANEKKKLSKRQLEKCKDVAKHIYKVTQGMEAEKIKGMIAGEAQEIVWDEQ